MNVEIDAGPDGTKSYHADIFRSQTFVCRIALAGTYEDHAAAEKALTERVRAWLADFEKRGDPKADS